MKALHVDLLEQDQPKLRDHWSCDRRITFVGSVLAGPNLDLRRVTCGCMPKAKTSKRTRRVPNRATFFYDDNPCKGESVCYTTVKRSAGGRVLRTTSKLKTGTSINGDSADPWTTEFFDANTETVVVDSNDSPPVWALDELPDSNPLESQPEPKEQCIVRMSFIVEC